MWCAAESKLQASSRHDHRAGRLVVRGHRSTRTSGRSTTRIRLRPSCPQPVHGEVRAAFDVTRAPHTAGRRLLIQPSAQDAKIQFIAAPGSGLTAVDQSRIATEVRKVHSRRSEPAIPSTCRPTLCSADFKGLGSGSNQVIALPFQLSGAASPPNGLQSLTQSFLGSSGFGFAVS